MSGSALYRAPVLLDPAVHRTMRVDALADFSVAARLHAVFVTATEFAQAALDFPLVFVATGERDAKGRPGVSPIALLGLSEGENLHVDGTRWDARYIPASIRRFPFLAADVKGLRGPGVLVDTAWSGFSERAAEALFEADGSAAPALRRALDFLERFELEAARTRAFCERLADLDLLKEMKADATLPGGASLSVDGFHAVDEDRLQALPDATVLELHRNGLLTLLHVHLLSLNNIRHLVNRKAKRLQADVAGAARAAPPTP